MESGSLTVSRAVQYRVFARTIAMDVAQERTRELGTARDGQSGDLTAAPASGRPHVHQFVRCLFMFGQSHKSTMTLRGGAKNGAADVWLRSSLALAFSRFGLGARSGAPTPRRRSARGADRRARRARRRAPERAELPATATILQAVYAGRAAAQSRSATGSRRCASPRSPCRPRRRGDCSRSRPRSRPEWRRAR